MKRHNELSHVTVGYQESNTTSLTRARRLAMNLWNSAPEKRQEEAARRREEATDERPQN